MKRFEVICSFNKNEIPYLVMYDHLYKGGLVVTVEDYRLNLLYYNSKLEGDRCQDGTNEKDRYQGEN